MVNLRLVLMLFAFVCFVLSALPPASARWNQLVSVGLACWVAALIFV